MRHEFSDALEVRFAPPAEDGAIEGIAVRFGTLDSYGTTIDPAAFGKLDGRQIPMLWAHRSDEVIGSWTSFRTSDKELRIAGKLNLEVQRAREVRAMLAAGDVRGLSVGFSTLKAESRGTTRHITRATLMEVSLTAFPAVPGSRVTAVRTDDRAGAAARLTMALRSAARAISHRS